MTVPATHREVERKLRVHAMYRIPPLAGAAWGVASVEPRPPVEMTAVYHDTEDLRLMRWGVTLRRREGGADEGWHLKLPVEGAGHGVRDEMRVPLDAGRVGEVPMEIADVVTSLVREAPLVPVVTLRTARSPYALLDAEGREVAELVDDTVSVYDGDRVASVFRELEVEASDAESDLDVLGEVVEILMEQGAVPGTASKAASALGPQVSEPPDVVAPDWPGPDGAAGDAVRALLATHARRFLLQDVRVRRDLPDAVHQMRVAARRLRSGLRVFGPLVDERWATDLRDELGWLAGEMGLVRDTEVLMERLDDHSRALSPEDGERVRAAVDPWLSARMDVARAEALEDLRSDRYRRLLADLVDGARAPRLTPAADRPAGEALPPLVDKAWRRLEKDVDRLTLEGASETWHKARIHAKRARYAVEAVAPVFGKPAQRLAAQLERVTELLGEHQDAYVAQGTVRELSAHDDVDGATGFSLGLLHSFEVEQEILDRVRFEEVWPEVRRTYRRTRLVPADRHGGRGAKRRRKG